MSQRVLKAREACSEALALLKHRLTLERDPTSSGAHGTEATESFSRQALLTIEMELEAMLRILEPDRFVPGYGRYIVDSCIMDDPLAIALMEALYRYERIRPKDHQALLG